MKFAIRIIRDRTTERITVSDVFPVPDTKRTRPNLKRPGYNEALPVYLLS